MYNYFNFITIVSLVVMCSTIYVSLYKRQHGALVSIYVRTYDVRTYIRTFVRTYVRMYVCTYVRMYVCHMDFVTALSLLPLSLSSLFFSLSLLSLSPPLSSLAALSFSLSPSLSLSLSLSLSFIYTHSLDYIFKAITLCHI